MCIKPIRHERLWRQPASKIIRVDMPLLGRIPFPKLFVVLVLERQFTTYPNMIRDIMFPKFMFLYNNLGFLRINNSNEAIWRTQIQYKQTSNQGF